MATAVIARLKEVVGSNPPASILSNLQGALSAAQISVLVNDDPRIAALPDKARTQVLDGVLLATASPALSGPATIPINEAAHKIGEIDSNFNTLHRSSLSSPRVDTLKVLQIWNDFQDLTTKSLTTAQFVSGLLDKFAAELSRIRNTEDADWDIATEEFKIDKVRPMVQDAVSAFPTWIQGFNVFVTSVFRVVDWEEQHLEHQSEQFGALDAGIVPSGSEESQDYDWIMHNAKTLIDKIQQEGVPALGFWIGILSTAFQTCENDFQSIKTWFDGGNRDRSPAFREADEGKRAEIYRNMSDYLNTYVKVMTL